MGKFDILTKDNAQDFFDLYMGRKDTVLEEFRNNIANQGGPELAILDYSPESLTPLWKWLYPRFEKADKHTKVGNVPPWYLFQTVNNEHFGEIGVSVETLNWIDGLAYYFGEVVVRNIPSLQWQIEKDKKTFHYNKPVIDGPTQLYPLNNIIVVTIRAILNTPQHSNNGLLERFNIIVSDAKLGEQYEETKSYVDVDKCDPEDEWDYIISLDEGLENTIGEEKFSKLEELFSKLKSVDKAMHEDREIIYVKSKSRKSTIKNQVVSLLYEMTPFSE